MNSSSDNKIAMPRIGIAMSGAAARSVFYIGFLEVLAEHNIPIYLISGSSAASFVAAAFACGELELLKQHAFKMDRKFVFDKIQRGKEGGGWYSLDKFEDYVRDNFTKGKNLEAVTPRLTLMAADLEHGEQIAMSMGDIARAVRISCTIPGIFEPVKWGSRTLVDGGLLNYIPSEVLRQSGCDVVIGVHVRASRHIFRENQLFLKDIYNQIKRFVSANLVEKIVHKLSGIQKKEELLDYFEDVQMFESEDERNKGMFSIIGRSLDLAIEANKKTNKQDINYGCDLLISTGTGNFGGSVDLKNIQQLYEDGRVAAQENLPKIIALIQAKQKVKNTHHATA